MSAHLKPEQARALRQAIADGSFGAGFPYGDLREVLYDARVDDDGRVRWIEVCYCRAAFGVAMKEELPFFEPYFTAIDVADARDPRGCKGYPHCYSCDCTRKKKLPGQPFMDVLDDVAAGRMKVEEVVRREPRWLGWKGKVTEREARLNAANGHGPAARGSARNLADGSVEVAAEGSQGNLDALRQRPLEVCTDPSAPGRRSQIDSVAY